MNSEAKTGAFLCKCGDKIDSFVDLLALEAIVSNDPNVAHCEIMPYTCLNPGFEQMTSAITKKGINRVVIAGCDSRLMLKKMEDQLEPFNLLKGQISMVNLRGHVAISNDLSPEQRAEKSGKLIKAAAAEMAALEPSIQKMAKIEGPVAIVGGGISSFTAANEFARNNRECLLSIDTDIPDEIIGGLYKKYPGERQHYKQLKKIITQTLNSPCVKLLPHDHLQNLTGITGDYTLTYANTEDESVTEHKAGAIIACMDAELTSPDPGFGYDGKTVISQSDIGDGMLNKEILDNIVFWINDYEAGYPEFAHLSIQSAWSIAQSILNRSQRANVSIIFNEQIPIPLSATERALSRNLGVQWIPYDKSIYPTLQEGYLSFCGLNDHVEHEISWDLVILSPQRKVSAKSKRTAKILGLFQEEDNFLSCHHPRVRPDMRGHEGTYLAGSAKYPCSLHEAMNQGRKAGNSILKLFEKSDADELYLPRMVCVVDSEKCVGCGQCQEICDCGGISLVGTAGGGLPRVVDPMTCTGGGTCAAACPYNALTLNNSTTHQRETLVATLSQQLNPDEVIALACAWGGLPAADNAAGRGLTYDPKIHIVGVPCVGQIDPSVLARAFLEGAPGIILVGCLPEECHHSYGVDHAWSRVNFIKKLLTIAGFERKRIALAHADLNKPEEFIRTIENFAKTIASLGSIDKTPTNRSKLESIYSLAKNNSRVRYLLSSGLRRPWEKPFRGDQRHGLSYDQEFSSVLAEEFLQTRVLQLLQTENNPLSLIKLSEELNEDVEQIGNRLWEMVDDGIVSRIHKDSEAFYAII